MQKPPPSSTTLQRLEQSTRSNEVSRLQASQKESLSCPWGSVACARRCCSSDSSLRFRLDSFLSLGRLVCEPTRRKIEDRCKENQGPRIHKEGHTGLFSAVLQLPLHPGSGREPACTGPCQGGQDHRQTARRLFSSQAHMLLAMAPSDSRRGTFSTSRPD